MTSFIKKRRQHGLAASAMNILAVLGIGSAAHSETFDFDYFQSLGYINISEGDLHILLAEAILSGRPGPKSETQAQIVMGSTLFQLTCSSRKRIDETSSSVTFFSTVRSAPRSRRPRRLFVFASSCRQPQIQMRRTRSRAMRSSYISSACFV
jgi:hypothetical protein